jgi:hypothetical protein
MASIPTLKRRRVYPSQPPNPVHKDRNGIVPDLLVSSLHMVSSSGYRAGERMPTNIAAGIQLPLGDGRQKIIFDRDYTTSATTNDNQALALGSINGSDLTVQLPSTSDYVQFRAGVDATSSTEIFRIKGDGSTFIDSGVWTPTITVVDNAGGALVTSGASLEFTRYTRIGRVVRCMFKYIGATLSGNQTTAIPFVLRIPDSTLPYVRSGTNSVCLVNCHIPGATGTTTTNFRFNVAGGTFSGSNLELLCVYQSLAGTAGSTGNLEISVELHYITN